MMALIFSKKFWIFLLAVDFLSMAFLGGLWFLVQKQPLYPESVLVGGQVYTLEIADTQEKQTLGLGERDTLCDTCAMLFVFQTTDRHALWMKGMRFPLDIAWIAEDGAAVHIERRIAPESRDVYHPAVPTPYVLELNAGALDGVQVHDQVRFDPSL